MALTLLNLPSAPDSRSRNWSTAYLYNRSNTPIIRDFYSEMGHNNQITLDIADASYGWLYIHLPRYPYSRADFQIYLANNRPVKVDAAASHSSQWNGALQDGAIRTPTPLAESTTPAGLQRLDLPLAGDGNELHSSTDLLWIRLVFT